jgi:hypothetical protein
LIKKTLTAGRKPSFTWIGVSGLEQFVRRLNASGNEKEKPSKRSPLKLAKKQEAQRNKMEIEMLFAGLKEKDNKENEKLISASKINPKVLRETDVREIKEISLMQNPETKLKPSTAEILSNGGPEYQDMKQVDQVMMPRKANKEETAPQPISELLELSKKEKEQERSAEKNLSKNLDKEAWLEQQAKKYHMTSDQITDVFYYCSMDTNQLSQYLQGQNHLVWNEDEDTLLRGPAKTYAKRILGRYKGEANVKRRVEFLEKIDRLVDFAPKIKKKHFSPKI